MTAAEKPWTPDMKLRSDATNEQLEDRSSYYWEHRHEMRVSSIEATVARELASAVSAEIQKASPSHCPKCGEALA